MQYRSMPIRPFLSIIDGWLVWYVAAGKVVAINTWILTMGKTIIIVIVGVVVMHHHSQLLSL